MEKAENELTGKAGPKKLADEELEAVTGGSGFWSSAVCRNCGLRNKKFGRFSKDAVCHNCGHSLFEN